MGESVTEEEIEVKYILKGTGSREFAMMMRFMGESVTEEEIEVKYT
jgi:hypothetical protein